MAVTTIVGEVHLPVSANNKADVEGLGLVMMTQITTNTIHQKAIDLGSCNSRYNQISKVYLIEKHQN